MISKRTLLIVLTAAFFFNLVWVFEIGAEDTSITSDTGVINLGRKPGDFEDIKVGIGIKNPKAELHVRGKIIGITQQLDKVTLGRINENILGLRIEPVNKIKIVGFGKFGQISYNGEALKLYTGQRQPTTELNLGLTLLNNGNVGIGNSNPDAKLVVEGDVKISGSLDVSNLTVRNNLKTYHLTIPACDFVAQSLNLIGGPYYNGFDYVHNTDLTASLYLFSGLKLPDGATITKVNCYWTDAVSDNGQCRLKRSNLNEGRKQTLATLASRFNENNRRLNYTHEIEHPIVDNGEYAYGFEVIIPPGAESFVFHAVKVQYTY